MHSLRSQCTSYKINYWKKLGDSWIYRSASKRKLGVYKNILIFSINQINKTYQNNLVKCWKIYLRFSIIATSFFTEK